MSDPKIISNAAQELFHHARRAWHLELRDTYRVEQEDIPLARWLNGQQDDFEWLSEWLTFIREIAPHMKVERLRIVTLPHSTYTRWNLHVASLNVAVGEDVRYLPRHKIQDIKLPDEDCWLFDDEMLVLSLFKPNGRSAGFALAEDPALTTDYRTVRDRAWPRAIPYDQYVIR